MVNKSKSKKIKVMDRGMILTSRGMVRGPIERPYYESFESILTMITKYNLDVREVLPDNTEVKLTINNFNKDNTLPPEVIPNVVKPVEPKPEREIVPTQAIERTMTRKERKRLEHERKLADEKAKAEAEKVAEEENTSPAEEVSVPEEPSVEEAKVEEPKEESAEK